MEFLVYWWEYFIQVELVVLYVIYTRFDHTGHDWLYSKLHGGYVALAGNVYSGYQKCNSENQFY